MKQISTFLPGCILLLASYCTVAQTNPNDFPTSSLTDNSFNTVNECRRDDSDCNLRIAVKCTYTDSDGTLKNCIDNSAIKAQRPFLILTVEECKRKDSINAKITYTACNDNDVDFNPIPIKNDIRFRKDTSVKPTGWDKKIAPNTCREYIIEEEFDLCKQRRVLELQMDGNLSQNFPRYCRCFLYKQSFIRLTTPAPVPNTRTFPPTSRPTSSPISRPTSSPISRPTGYPTGYPTLNPTGYPTRYPTLNPTLNPTLKPSEVECDEVGVIITEVVSPYRNSNGRYIELFFPPYCDYHTIERDLVVSRHTKDGKSSFTVPLKGEKIPQDRFMVLCLYFEANTIYGQGTCDITTGQDYPPDLEGTDTIMVEEHKYVYYKPIDVYGHPSPNADRSDQDFTGGRAVRKLPYKSPEPFWNKNQWHIIPGELSPTDNDPRVWKNVVVKPICKYFFTEFGDPKDNYEAGFIEIKSTCPNEVIPTNIYVNTWNFFKQYLSPVNKVPSDGYIIICRDKSVFEVTFVGKVCDIENPFVHPDGIHSIALLKDNSDVPIDIYGIKDQLLPTVLIFTDGRAYRRLDAPKGSGVCAPKDWVVIPGANGGTAVTTDMDPREWKEDPTKIFFTEFADPIDDPFKRFIELYSPNRRNYIIEEEFHLFKHEPSSGNIIGSYVLKGSKINGNGFIVLCSTYFDRCTEEAGTSSIINSDGTYAWTLQICDKSADCKVIDSYGVGCYSEGHSYEDGRAVRKKDAEPKPSKEFVLTHWHITRDVHFKDTDPGEWDEDKDGPNRPPSPTISAPTPGGGPHSPNRPPSPTISAPTPGGSRPSKGKGSKKKY